MGNATFAMQSYRGLHIDIVYHTILYKPVEQRSPKLEAPDLGFGTCIRTTDFGRVPLTNRPSSRDAPRSTKITEIVRVLQTTCGPEHHGDVNL